MNILIPDNVNKIIEKLMLKGYEAYVVGGCVRDALLGKKPDDWDLTTSATPQEVKELFRRTIDTGIAHGTVTIMEGKEGFEITTYRIDGEYADNRHPKEVLFTRCLEEDLRRRDFTINAMAYSHQKGLVDPFNGQEDLKNQCIRCVGDPRQRLKEDALRILRGIRFSAQLGFSIEQETAKALQEQAPTLCNISAERIQVELLKLLISPRPEILREAYFLGVTAVILPEFDAMMETTQETPHHCYNVGEHTIRVLQHTQADPTLRLTALLHDVGKPKRRTVDSDGVTHFKGHDILGEEMANTILKRFKFDNKTRKKVIKLVRYHDWRMPAKPKNVRRAMNVIGAELFLDYLKIGKADILGQSPYRREKKLARLKGVENCYKEILARKECVSIKDLAISGGDLLEVGMKQGSHIGNMLEEILHLVIKHPEYNEKEYLLDYVKNSMKASNASAEGESMNYLKKYQNWIEDPYFDEDTKEKLREIKEDEEEIRERFYRDLEFGTAGLRGIIGEGTNRINIYTIRKATQGLANYIIKCGAKEKGVAIAYDSRNMSPEFADATALCLAGNGIKSYVFESLRPTPELSYAVRELGCIAGVNITASHNPPEYNGYKVYWEDGAQITPPHDKGIMDEVKKVEDYNTMKTMSLKDAKKQGLYKVIESSMDDSYIEELKKQVIHGDAIKAMAKELKIVYSPLHGTGNIPVRRVLQELGFKQVYIVKEQELPDAKFSTVSYPNPESEEAFVLGLKLAHEVDADLVLATDPDADRLGVYVKDGNTGEYKMLTGNMSGCLLADYEIGQRKEISGLPKDGHLIKTIVTTNMADAIAKRYEVGLIEVLTGFKFIGQKILEFETTGKGSYLFGFEESYGCLIGTYARDKDAVVATMALCEAAAFYKMQGKTLWDVMIDMYEQYGYYKDDIETITLAGMEGVEKIQQILNKLRKDPPTIIGNYNVLQVRDYKEGTIRNLGTGEVHPINLPNSDVLYYELEKEAWICVRPSGTEPKMKFYYGVKGESLADAETISKKLGEEVLHLIDKILS